ncbi:MAG: hypothetical protein ABIR46_02585 [Candidatus Saccharimonadales bacterium]
MAENVRPTKKQSELLSFLEGFIAEHGYGPSYREIMRALDYKSVSTVATHVNGLIARGWLLKRDNSARSLEVVKEASASPVVTKVSATQEKWLVMQVQERFDRYEKQADVKLYDELFVLVGALHVLGLEDPASAFKTRLSQLAKQS